MPEGISRDLQGSAAGTEPRHQCQRLETLCLGALDPCLSSSSIRSGVNGTLISATPSASATALAMQAGSDSASRAPWARSKFEALFSSEQPLETTPPGLRRG